MLPLTAPKILIKVVVSRQEITRELENADKLKQHLSRITSL